MTHKSNQYFSQVAPQWDELRQGYFSEAIRELVIKKAYLRPEMSVADIGGGTGFLSSGLLPLVNQVHLVDVSPEMLSEARNKFTSWGNFQTHLADGLSIPLQDESLDAVFALYLHHCPDPLASIKEMVRLLKPNGRLVLTDLDSHPYTWLKEEMADEWLGFERDQIRSWLREAGLVNFFVDCTAQDCCASSKTESQGNEAKISTFIAVGTKPVKRKEAVQKSYSLIAESGCSCSAGDSAQKDCCPPAAQPIFYQPDQLSVVPTEAGDFSLGCGNPTAIANLLPGETVVDIGSGGGLDVFLAANKVGPEGKVIGVDMTDAMLQRARQSAQKQGYTQVEFRRGEAHALPVEDSTVDVVLSNCVINLTEDKGQTFREAYRVLKPGGRLEISDTVTTNTLPGEVRNDPQQWAACVSGSLPLEEYQDVIREAGFSIVATRSSTPTPVDEHSAVFSVTLSAVKK